MKKKKKENIIYVTEIPLRKVCPINFKIKFTKIPIKIIF